MFSKISNLRDSLQRRRINLTSVSNVFRAASIFFFPGAPNWLNELPEVRCVFPLILIGELTMAFLTGQSWHVLKSWYTGAGQEQRFRHCFADGLNQSLVSSVAQDTLWRAFLKRCTFGDRFYWIRVDGRPNWKLKTLRFQTKTETCGRDPKQTTFVWHFHALCLPGWTSLSSDDGRLLEYGLTNTLSLKSELVPSWLLFELSTLETVWKEKNSYKTVMAVPNPFFEFWSFSMATDCSQVPYFSVRLSTLSALRYGRPSWLQRASNLLGGGGGGLFGRRRFSRPTTHR